MEGIEKISPHVSEVQTPESRDPNVSKVNAIYAKSVGPAAPTHSEEQKSLREADEGEKLAALQSYQTRISNMRYMTTRQHLANLVIALFIVGGVALLIGGFHLHNKALAVLGFVSLGMAVGPSIWQIKNMYTEGRELEKDLRCDFPEVNTSNIRSWQYVVQKELDTCEDHGPDV